MKYKNYRNSYTNDNRIYSFNDIYNMPIGEVLKRKQELLSQYRVLGIPKEKELQTSDNVVYVHSYTRDDGTEVRGHWRSKPDGIANNNFSHENPTGGASNIDESKQIEQENTINDEELEYNDWDNIDLDTLKDLDEYIDKNIIDIMPDDIREIYEQLKQTQDEELSPALECKVSKQDLLNRIKEFAHYNIKPYRDYENLTPVEKAQKYLSKHMPYWTPNQYYGLSETLADEGKPLDKYKKYNNFCKLGEIKNVQLKEKLTNKVIKARKDCPVGPSINSPLEDVDVVIPKDNSPIVKEVLESQKLLDFIKENYDKLKAGKVVNGSIDFKQPTRDDMMQVRSFKDAQEFRKLFNRFTVLHNVKMESDGSITLELVDYYDFSKLDDENIFSKINNIAYREQLFGKMKPYIIYKKFKLKNVIQN